MIIRKKSVSVLSKASGDCSYIEKIYEKEMTVKNTSKAVNGQLRGNDMTKVVSETCYDYCIHFNIDTQKAINMKIGSIDYDITESEEVGNYKYFSNLPEKNGLGAIAAILGARTDLLENARKVKEDVKMSGRIDIGHKFIEHYQNSKKKYISKSRSLGESEVSKIVNVGSQEKRSPGSKLLYRHVPTSNIVENNIESFSGLYAKSLQSGLDSGQALASVSNTVGKNLGIILKGPDKISDEKRDLIKNSLRASIEQIQDPQPRTTSDLTNRSEQVAITQREVNKTTGCKLSITISDSMFIGVDSFILRLFLIDPSSGLSLQRLDITIPHARNIQNYYIPDSIPVVRINKEKRNSATSESFLNIYSQESEKVLCGKISTRIIPRETSLKSSIFTTYKMEKEEYRSYKFQSGFKNTGPKNGRNGFLLSNETDMAIVRFCPTTYTNETISNFSSDTIVGNRFDLGFASFFAENVGPDIKISYGYNPREIHGITIFKRRPGEKYVEMGKFPSHVGDSERFNNLRVPNYHDFYTAQDFKPLPGAKYGDVIDTGCRPGRVYEYKILFHFLGGQSRFSNTTISILKESPMRYVTVKILNRKIENFNGASSTVGASLSSKEGADTNLSYIKVRFNLDYDIRDNSTDMIIQSLKRLGLEDIFNKEIQDLKSLIKDFVLFGVTRHDIDNSSSEFLGYYPAGEFVDDGKYNSPPNAGINYNYEASAYLINPETVVSSKQDSIFDGNQNIQNAMQLRDPKNLSKIQKSATDSQAAISQRSNADQVIGTTDQKKLEIDYNKRKVRKNLSKSALEKSTIDPNETSGQDYDISRFSTGDKASIRVFQGDTNFSVNTSTGFLTRSSTGVPVLRFSVAPADSFSSISKIDYFLITCERQGDISICGTAHNDGTGKITFLDFLNKEHIGNVSYYITSVSVDGRVDSRKKIGSAILRDTREEMVQVRGY